MDKRICPICRWRPVGRNRSGRCEVCQTLARALLRGIKDAAGQPRMPAPVAPLIWRPMPPRAEVDQRLAEWLTRMEAAQCNP